jgi:hypothetical protein
VLTYVVSAGKVVHCVVFMGNSASWHGLCLGFGSVTILVSDCDNSCQDVTILARKQEAGQAWNWLYLAGLGMCKIVEVFCGAWDKVGMVCATIVVCQARCLAARK